MTSMSTFDVLIVVYVAMLGLVVVFVIVSFVYDAVYSRAWRDGFDEARRLYTWVEDHVPDELNERKPR